MVWVKRIFLFCLCAMMALGCSKTKETHDSKDEILNKTTRTLSVKTTSESSGQVIPQGMDSANLAKKTKRKPKTGLAFVLAKAKLLCKLCLYIVIGVFLANILEITGVVRYLAFLAWPIIKLGKLEGSTGSAFLMAFQSGAIANSILVANRDSGIIDNRQLYSSILVVSCLSLFAHLPVYVLPIGAILGAEATVALFVTRFAAIAIEIVVILLIGSLIYKQIQRRVDRRPDINQAAPREQKQKSHKKPNRHQPANIHFIKRVWMRSRKTLVRLLIYVVPTFLVMGTLEYTGVFSMLSKAAPGLFTLDFLPVQSTVIIPAQALSLYNGAIAAAGFVNNGDIQVKQAVLIILAGSIITAPIRTLKHAMPTYVAILGAKVGAVLAVTAQVLRSVFLVVATIGLWFLW